MPGSQPEGAAPEEGFSRVDDAAKAIEGLLSRGKVEFEKVDESRLGPDRDRNRERAKADEPSQDDDVVDDEEGEEITQSPDEQSGDAEVDSSDVEQSEGEEQEPISTLAELAQALETPIEDLAANLKTTVKVNGEEIEVTLAELQAGYQKERDYRQKTEGLARERESFRATAAEAAAQYQREAQALAAFTGEINRLVIGELDPNEMARLRQEDPAEWAARREEYNLKIQRLNAIRQAAAQQWDHHQALVAKEMEDRQRELVAKEAARLAEKLPEWGKDLDAKLSSYLTSETVGYTPADIAQVFDHRLVILANKARLYDEMQSTAQKTVERVQKAPKRVIKPKAPANPVNVQRGKVNQLKGRLKQTGSIRDAAKLLEARL